MNFIKTEIVSSSYRAEKLYIFANRISAFNYWRVVDNELVGVLSFPEFTKLLEVFGIKGISNDKGFCDKKDIDYVSSINTYNKESSIVKINSNSVPSYRIFEYLFLEKCLLV